MTDDQTTHSLSTDDINLLKMIQILWKGKITIILLIILGAMLSIGYALYLPDIYQSKALLVPKKYGSDSGLSRLAAQYSGIASFAGVDLRGATDPNEAAVAIETLKSQTFFQDFLYETVLVELMAVTSWESMSNSLTINPEIYDKKQNMWVREASYPKKRKPSAQEAFEKFSALVDVSQDEFSVFVSVSAEHFSPVVARRWVNLMVDSVNTAIRDRAIDEAQRSIEFLTKQRDATPLVFLDEMFAQLIEEQIKTIMLANVSDAYVFQVIDPAIASERKSKPNRTLICILGTLLGGMFAILVVLIKNYYADAKRWANNGNVPK